MLKASLNHPLVLSNVICICTLLENPNLPCFKASKEEKNIEQYVLVEHTVALQYTYM